MLDDRGEPIRVTARPNTILVAVVSLDGNRVWATDSMLSGGDCALPLAEFVERVVKPMVANCRLRAGHHA